MKNPTITAWKCYDTAKLFESESQYRTHRFDYIAKRRDNNRRGSHISMIDKKIIDFRKSAKSFNEITEWLIENSGLLVTRQQACNVLMENYRNSNFQFTDINWYVRFNKHCSNTHACPINGGITNWGNQITGSPTGYPGFKGKISYRYRNNTTGRSLHDLLGEIGIFTGTGSGISDKSFKADVTLFAADWPELFNEYEKNRIEKMFKSD